MESPGKLADDAYEYAYEPTTGSQQFWWLADSVPLGRVLVIAVLAAGLVGVGYGLGRLGQRVVVQTVNVPILAPRDEPLPTASRQTPQGVVLDASLHNPSAAHFETPAYVEFQPRLPWEEAPSYLDPALLVIDNRNRHVTAVNLRSMQDYVQHSRRAQATLERPASEAYYVTRRAPAYSRPAQVGDKPLRYLLPGTQLRLERTQARWALVTGPSGEAMWIKASMLSTTKTHRSS
jgi:hypothetical protein